jgi:hypothetical protein
LSFVLATRNGALRWRVPPERAIWLSGSSLAIKVVCQTVVYLMKMNCSYACAEQMIKTEAVPVRTPVTVCEIADIIREGNVLS